MKFMAYIANFAESVPSRGMFFLLQTVTPSTRRFLPMPARLCSSALGIFLCASLALCFDAHASAEAKTQTTLDPAAWGENHANQTLPLLDDGSQCLFCHRGTVGLTWQQDRHNKTVRRIEEAPEDKDKLLAEGVPAELIAEITHLIGDTRHHAYLKPNAAYGNADLLRRDGKNSTWRESAFNESCAACHATAYDSTLNEYQSLALDCATCHGQPPLSHTEFPQEALFNRTAEPAPRVTASICASCHIRDGKSRSLGRPHANNFIPGDNLFQDLETDWSDAEIEKLNPADRHIMDNLRDIVLYGKEDVTCLTCHSIHKQNSIRHRKLPESPSCFICHTGTDTKSGVREYEVHSGTCGY